MAVHLIGEDVPVASLAGSVNDLVVAQSSDGEVVDRSGAMRQWFGVAPGEPALFIRSSTGTGGLHGLQEEGSPIDAL
ncbi:hypothetical protein M6B38_139860 [Iris pallida]|uniref:Uncharacterized protein n=1 Tax=Iris pallida TaxID=29817 RepID=A0AAX6FDN8_IRIPA|nr:hypothetical protein M6B38_139860 [Iris pallida]